MLNILKYVVYVLTEVDSLFLPELYLNLEMTELSNKVRREKVVIVCYFHKSEPKTEKEKGEENLLNENFTTLRISLFKYLTISLY